MAQTSQQPIQQPPQCRICNLVFDSNKSLETHLLFNHNGGKHPDFSYNRGNSGYPGYVLGPGADFPVIPSSNSPHSPQPNSAPHQNSSFRYHPYSHGNSYLPESPRNNVSSSSPVLNNPPRTRALQCDGCNFITDNQQRLLDHKSVAHAKSPTSNFPFNDCNFPPPPPAKTGNQAEEILDLDSQKVHVYNPPLNESEENGINGRNHSVNAMVSSWVNNSMPEKKFYPMNHQNGSLPSPDFGSVTSTTISPPNSENMQQMPSMNNFQHFEGNAQLPSQISSSQSAGNVPTPVSNGKSGKSSGSGGSWKSNEARRPKTYNCSACNKWFTSSGHLKRHYNTTLHKNAVKQSNQPDPASMPISAHHHPHKDPAYAASLGSVQCSTSPRALSDDGPVSQLPSKNDSDSPGNSVSNTGARNVASPSHYSNYVNFLSNSPNLMAGPSEHQSGGLLLTHPHLPQINSHLTPMDSHLPPMSSHLSPINSHLTPINPLSSISPLPYHHPPQYPPTSSIHHIPSTSPIPTMPTQFMPLATSQGIPPSQCPGSPGPMPMPMSYPNLQPPHVSTTQITTTNSNFGNLNPEGLQEFNDLQQGDNYFAVNNTMNNFNEYQNLNYNQMVESNYHFNNSQSIVNSNEDVGGHVSPLLTKIKVQSPHDESFSMENYTKINYSPTSNGIAADSRSDSGLETSSPSPLDIKKEYMYEPNVYEDQKVDFSMENNNFLIKETVTNSAAKKKKSNCNKKKVSIKQVSEEKNQVVTSTFDSFSSSEPASPKVENKPIHRCEECDKIFNRSCYLTQHNKSFHSGVEKPFKCNRCGKRFVCESLHIEHLSKHGGDKPFKCEQCPKQFNHKTDLRRHMCLHSGEKPFSCDFCGKGFIRKDHMLKHTETHKRKQSSPAMYNKIQPQKIVS